MILQTRDLITSLLDIDRNRKTEFIIMDSPSEKVDKKEASHNLKHSILPLAFKPSLSTVIVGRGKDCKTAPGNVKLRELATNFLVRYCKANGKSEKSEILTEIVRMVRESCPNGGAFVKKGDGGRWIELDDHGAREKVGYVLRDLLHDKYRSSSQSKTIRRRTLQSHQNLEVKKDGTCEYDNKESSKERFVTVSGEDFGRSLRESEEMPFSSNRSASSEIMRIQPRFGVDAVASRSVAVSRGDYAIMPQMNKNSFGSPSITESREYDQKLKALPTGLSLPQPIPLNPSKSTLSEKIAPQESQDLNLRQTGNIFQGTAENPRRQSLTGIFGDDRLLDLEDFNDCNLSDEEVSSEIFD